ncbi:MAG TPA: nicotinate-nucleotide adenylyltransferase [Bryobacteraceae bacterium]|nr:nicotinate-nucleotide adenylyltransferase [Bryobacteraceae bacterium]
MREPTPRTALFGGTFDPIHNAHLEIARAAADRFGLEKILFVPAAHPPHKPGGTAAAYEHRVRMTELACADDPRFEVSRIEEGEERSYSIVTIEKLRAPGVSPLAFLIGADAFREIRTWYRWRDVVASVEFIVVTRPGFDAGGAASDGAVVHELAGLDLAVSSSEIRARVAAADAGVPVPAAVLAYIREHRLYGSQPQ